MQNNSRLTSSLPALRIIENEHYLLTHLMNEWHPIVLAFEQDQFTQQGEGLVAIQSLRQKLVEFSEVLSKHTLKEEKYLFPKLAKYIGNEQGPVKATEDEHGDITMYIEHFLHHTEGDLSMLTLEQMGQLAQDAGEIYEVLTFHFVKEESVIFPMVEDILSNNEQYDLFENLYSQII